jgi:hypothetical protein
MERQSIYFHCAALLLALVARPPLNLMTRRAFVYFVWWNMQLRNPFVHYAGVSWNCNLNFVTWEKNSARVALLAFSKQWFASLMPNCNANITIRKQNRGTEWFDNIVRLLTVFWDVSSSKVQSLRSFCIEKAWLDWLVSLDRGTRPRTLSVYASWLREKS